MNQPINLKTTTPAVRIDCGPHLQVRGFALMALACFAFLSMARAVSPPPDGGYANGNTAEGAEALNSLTTGNSNTATGSEAGAFNATGGSKTATSGSALGANTTGSHNTANGINALLKNTTGDANTANGSGALQNNTTGNQNTATGFQALYRNSTGGFNTATGGSALLKNTTGADNTGNGASALFNNSTGTLNTATGAGALFTNTTGGGNTATGASALFNNNADNNTANGINALLKNTTGDANTANGSGALVSNTTGHDNTAEGFQALVHNTTGLSNIAVGSNAGSNLTTGSNNIDIGALGAAGESDHIRIGKVGMQNGTFVAGIYGATVASGVGVIVGSNGQLGTVQSSERFENEIKPMDKASEAILALKPVTFRYKKELDPDSIPQFGLIAEQVEKVNPDLVARDADGKVNTVRYEAVNAMLLNEFLKAHRRMEEQGAMIAKQQKEIEALTARQKSRHHKTRK